MGIGSTVIVVALIGLAIAFAIVVLIALLIGIGLTQQNYLFRGEPLPRNAAHQSRRFQPSH